jgi:nicotinamide mononucleotide transporter
MSLLDATTIVDTRPPFTGTTADRRQALFGGLAASAVTIGYVILARLLGTSTTWVEGLALWASLACVWLARTENIWTMPYGIVSVLLLGWYLLDVGLVGQGWLQYVFYVPVQCFGWWAWARGGPERTELRVSRLGALDWLILVAVSLVAWAGMVWLFETIYDGPAFVVWDTSIVVASVVAQTLMTVKKRESWWWWTVPVNVSAIGLFIRTESWAFVFLYVVFLANSIWGWRQWSRADAAS